MSLETQKEKKTPYGTMVEKHRRGLIRTKREKNTFMLWRKIVELSDREDIESLDHMRMALEVEGIGVSESGQPIQWKTSRKALDKLFRRVWGPEVSKEKIRDMKERKRNHRKYQKYFDLTHEQETDDSFTLDYVTTADAFELRRDVATRELSGEIMPIITVKQARNAGFRKIPYTRAGDFGVGMKEDSYDFSTARIVRNNIKRALRKELNLEFDKVVEKQTRKEMKEMKLSTEISDRELAKLKKRTKRRVKARMKKTYYEPRLTKIPTVVDAYMEKIRRGDKKSAYVHGGNHPIDWQLDPAYASKDKETRGEQRMRALPGRYWSRTTLNIPFLNHTPPKRVQISAHAIAKNQAPFRLVDPEPPAYRAEYNDLEGINTRVRFPRDPKENLMTMEAGVLVTKDFAKRASYVYVSPVKELIVENLGDLRRAPRVDEAFTEGEKGSDRAQRLKELGEHQDAFVRRGDMLVRHTFPGFGRVQYAADHTGMLVYVGSPAKDDGTQYYRTLKEGEPYTGCTHAPEEGVAGATVNVKQTKKGRVASIVELGEAGGETVCGQECTSQTQTINGKEIMTNYCPVHGMVGQSEVAKFERPKTMHYYRQKYQIVRQSELKVGDKLFSRNGVKGVISDVVRDLGKDKKNRSYDMVINGEDVWGEGPQARLKGKQKAGIVLERRSSDGTVFLFLDGNFSADTPFTPKSGLSISNSFLGGILEKEIDVNEFNRAYMQGTLLPDIFKALHLKAEHDTKTGKVTVVPDPEPPRPGPGYTLRTDPDIIRLTHTINNNKYKYMYVPKWVARKYFSQGSIRENVMTYKKLFEQVVNRFDLLPTYNVAMNLKAVPWVPPRKTDDTRIVMDVSDMLQLGYDPRSAIPFRVSIRKEPVSIAESIQTYNVVPDTSGKYKNCVGIHPMLAKKGIIDFDGDEVVAFTPAMEQFSAANNSKLKLSNREKNEMDNYVKYDWKDLEKKADKLELPDEELAVQCARWNQRQFQDDKNIYRLGGIRKRFTLSRGDEVPTLSIMGEDVKFTQRKVNIICNVEKIMKENVPFSEVVDYAKQVLGPKNKHTSAQQKAELAKIKQEHGAKIAELVVEEIERRELDRYLKRSRNPYYTLFGEPTELTQKGKWEGFLQFEHGRKHKFVLDPSKRIVDRYIIQQIKDDKDIFIEK